MALTKILNDENKSFQPVLTDKLVYDTKPTVNSFNGITSDAVARAIAGASGEVPAVTESDNGKVLTAVYDEGGAAVEWADAPSGIPDMTSQDGKILGAVDNGGTMEAQWINKPEVTAADKSITVSNNAVAVNHDDTLTIATRTSAVGGLSVTAPISGYPTVKILGNSDLYRAFVNDAEITITFDNGIDVLATYSAFARPESGTRAQLAFVSNRLSGTSGEVSLPSPMFKITTPSSSFIPVKLDNPNSSGLSVTFKASDLRDKNGNAITNVTNFAYSGVDLCFIDSGLADTSSSGVCGKKVFSFDNTATLTATATVTEPYALTVATPIPSVTGNAGKVLAVNSDATGVEWVAPEYTMVYNTTPAGGSWDEEPWNALNAGKRIGCVVPYTSFTGTLAAGSIMSTGKIYMPLASVVNSGSLVYKWNFYLYDGYNKWSLVLTCDEDEWSWGTPNVVPG